MPDQLAILTACRVRRVDRSGEISCETLTCAAGAIVVARRAVVRRRPPAALMLMQLEMPFVLDRRRVRAPQKTQRSGGAVWSGQRI